MAIVINGSGTVTGISVGGLPDDIVDAGTLADNAVGLAQMAGGTDGNIITYDTSGNPAAVATGSSGQVLTSAGADAVPTMATLSAGKVLQVVQDTYATQVTTTPSSWTDTGLSATITPTSASSKILVMGGSSLWSGSNAYIRGAFNRSISGGSDTFLGDATDGLAMTINGASEGNQITLNYLDSPSTTSATTYHYQFKCSSEAMACKSAHTAVMILIEIAG